jgi:hypothetical protein
LLLRIVTKTPLVHIPRVTCEYRMIEGSGGATGSNPPGSPGQLAALEAMWKRHGVFDDGGKMAAGVMSLIAARDRAAEAARIRDEELLEARGGKGGLEAEYKRVRAEGERLAIKNEELKQRLGEAETARAEAMAEIERLTAVIDMITNSRTWKLKEFFNSLLGRTPQQ